MKNKFITTFENFNEYINIEFEKMKSHKIGDIISNDILYKYIDALHDFDMDNDFIKNHILKYSKFELCNLLIDDIDLDSVSKSLVNEYLDEYKKTNWYPPIIYDKDEDLIIDGYHRANAIEKSGDKFILSWCGVSSTINPFYEYD